jgi:thermolysin metallopeptidase-like protein
MEAVAKIAIYLTLGLALLGCNIWFVRSVYHSVTGGDLVVAPVKVVGGKGDAAIMGETLARLIISKLQSLEWDLRQSQSALRPEDAKDARKPEGVTAKPSGVTAGILGTPKTAVLNAQLFEPTNIDVKVAGVDVGGLLPGIQRWFVADRTLAFSVSWEGDNATVAGSIDALGVGKSRPVWFSIKDANANTIAEAIALALIHRRWARDSVEFGELEDSEFARLVTAINDVARLNRRVITYNAVAKADFETILPTVEPLAERINGWSELTYFVASIAEAAEKYDRALTLYRRMRNAAKSPLTADVLAAKIAALEGMTTTPSGDTKATALQKLKKSVSEATQVLNFLFGVNLAAPEIELLGDEVLNAYWDGKKIFAPPAVQDIPDVIYHEVAWPFVQSKWAFRYEGQPGALVQSYTDVLASLVKQAVHKQDAKTADWTIGPGAIAWITGKPAEIGKDPRPLRSIKAPGTAYDDPTIGKDPQVDHFSRLIKGSEDSGGVHTNSGVPNKAFYETAIRIGSEKAGKIWIASLPQFTATTDLRKGSQAIYKTAVELFGEGSAEAGAVKAAWNTVGL